MIDTILTAALFVGCGVPALGALALTVALLWRVGKGAR